MSAKKKSKKPAPKAVARTSIEVPREIISTCQIKTTSGTPVTWTAFRQVGAPPSAQPDCYMTTLPDNTPDSTPSEYDLNAIAAQAKTLTITLRVLDQDVVYYVTEPGGKPVPVPVARGEEFTVPARGTPGEVTTVTLTFTEDCCTIEAVPNRSGPTPPEEGREAELQDGEGEGGPPDPLPNAD